MIMHVRSLLLAIALAGCGTSEPTPPPQPAPSAAKDPATARKLVDSGATVIDVRTPDEYADGHLPSAVNIPVQDMPVRIAEVDKLVGGDKTKPIVVYCAKGGRAAKAKAALEAKGYTQVVNGGGYDDLR